MPVRPPAEEYRLIDQAIHKALKKHFQAAQLHKQKKPCYRATKPF
jgi:hypothetical protein